MFLRHSFHRDTNSIPHVPTSPFSQDHLPLLPQTAGDPGVNILYEERRVLLPVPRSGHDRRRPYATPRHPQGRRQPLALARLARLLPRVGRRARALGGAGAHPRGAVAVERLVRVCRALRPVGLPLPRPRDLRAVRPAQGGAREVPPGVWAGV